MASKLFRLKRDLHRIIEEIYSTKEISKVVGLRKALVTLKGKFDIQLMVHSGRIEYDWIKKDLLNKHKVMNEYFEKANIIGREKETHTSVPLQKPKYKDCIWVCWWQGLENAPKIVKCCIDSIRANAGNHNVIIITDENYHKYVEFPEWIERKKKAGIITKTHISDLLRLSLLAQYGGVWLDSTFYCTGSLEPCFSTPIWSIKRPDYRHVSVACGEFANYSFGCTSENRKIFAVLRDYLLDYWKNYDYMIDYLFLDYLIVLASKRNKEVADAFKTLPPNNKNCDELLKKLGMIYDPAEWSNLKENTTLFKLTWKANFPNEIGGKQTFYGKLLNGELL